VRQPHEALMLRSVKQLSLASERKIQGSQKRSTASSWLVKSDLGLGPAYRPTNRKNHAHRAR